MTKTNIIKMIITKENAKKIVIPTVAAVSGVGIGSIAGKITEKIKNKEEKKKLNLAMEKAVAKKKELKEKEVELKEREENLRLKEQAFNSDIKEKKELTNILLVSMLDDLKEIKNKLGKE